MKYRKEIDGLRAVAVLPVIFFHAGFEFFSGGFAGVDVFFVISGYLITTIIVNERAAGCFTLLSFYERRARRILPALFCVIVFSLPFAWLWMLPGQLKDFARSLVAAATFSSNLLFWLESGYFEAAAELKPFLHTWSLAVEEQYYLLFPLLILGLWRLGRCWIAMVLFSLGLFSLGLAQWLSGVEPVANFYLLPTRLWELLAGSLTAFYRTNSNAAGTAVNVQSDSKSGVRQQLFSAAGLALVVGAILMLDDQTPFPGFYALLPVAGTVLIIICGTETTWVGRLLANRLLVGIGLISYSAYLWHHLLFAFARLRSLTEPGYGLMLSLGGLSLLLAFFTWKYVEQPFRNRAKFKRKTIFQYAAGFTVLTISIGAIGNFNDGFERRITADGVSYAQSKLSERIRINQGLSELCDNAFTLSEACKTDDEPEVLVWGDSFAMHLLQGIIASKPDVKLIQMTKSGCGPVFDIAPATKDYPISWSEGCLAFTREVKRWVMENNSVRYAVLSSPFIQYLNDDYQILSADGIAPAGPDLALTHFFATLSFLEEQGIQPVIFAPPPSNEVDNGACLSKATILGDSYEACRIKLTDYQDKQKAVIDFLRRIDEKYSVIWIGDFICDAMYCNTAIDGHFIYRDGGHLSHEGSAFVGEQMNFYQLITEAR